MKTIIRNSRILIIVISTFIAGLTPVLAIDPVKLPVELKSLADSGNHSVIQLYIGDNSQHHLYTVIIRDEFGNIIYKDNFRGATINKKFLFDTDELGNDTLQFEVYCAPTNQSVVYALNRQAKYAATIVISELK